MLKKWRLRWRAWTVNIVGWSRCGKRAEKTDWKKIPFLVSENEPIEWKERQADGKEIRVLIMWQTIILSKQLAQNHYRQRNRAETALLNFVKRLVPFWFLAFNPVRANIPLIHARSLSLSLWNLSQQDSFIVYRAFICSYPYNVNHFDFLIPLYSSRTHWNLYTPLSFCIAGQQLPG